MRPNSSGKVSDRKSCSSFDSSNGDVLLQCPKAATVQRIQDIKPKTARRMVRFRSICEEILDDDGSNCSSSPDLIDIEREELPNGSDVFQQILREMTGGLDDFQLNNMVDKADTSETDISKPDISKTGVRTPDISKTGVRKPDISKTGVRKPDISKTGVRKPDISKTGVRKPDISETCSSKTEISVTVIVSVKQGREENSVKHKSAIPKTSSLKRKQNSRTSRPLR